jgi:hypothetical protein
MMFTDETTQMTSCIGVVFDAKAHRSYNHDLAGTYRNTVQFGEMTSDRMPEKNSQVANVYPGTYFGTGKTPASADDLKLESVITSGLSARSGGYSIFKEAPGRYVFEQRYDLTNITDANITINEMGMVRPVASGETNSPWYYPVLFDRTVCDEPIVIEPNETRLVVYRIIFNQSQDV